MGILDFIKDKFGSAGSGTVTNYTEAEVLLNDVFIETSRRGGNKLSTL